MPASSPHAVAASDAATSTSLLLLRHGPTDWNQQGRWQGWSDQPLTGAAESAAARWGELCEHRFDAIFASDLRRASQTAGVIAAALGHRGGVSEVAGLREQDAGEWTGLTKAEIKGRWPDRLRERPRRPVGGESPQVLLERALAALQQIARAQPSSVVLAVAHAGVIRTLEGALGVAAPAVPHLEGRWVTIGPAAGPLAGVQAGPLTPGRVALADTAVAGTTTVGVQ